MAAAKLAVKNVSHSFAVDNGQLEVLSSITMHVEAGEFVSLIGPSGCGKSTLFNIIAGIMEPAGGKITIDGRTLPTRIGKSGYMPQKPLLLAWQTVRQNVLLGPSLKRRLDKATEHEADALLDKFGLSEFADSYPNVLSGGMSQKAALIRTIINGCDFLLMDEPFGALDAITRLQMQLWLLEVWREMRSTALLITHDIREAILLSDRIYVLSQRPGTIIKEVSVNLPRPRSKQSLSRPTALKLEAELENLLLQS